MKRRILGSLMLVLALAGCGEKVFQYYWQQGQERYEAGDYAGAFEKLYVLAEQGHAAAQLDVGFLYLAGHGVRQDIEKGFEWIDKAAENGNAIQKLWAGLVYYMGKAPERDRTEDLLLKYIRSILGSKQEENSDDTLATSPGMKKDHEKAAYWWEAAIHQDDSNILGRRIIKEIKATASFGLGLIHSSRQSDMQDGEKAVYWLEFSVQEGCLPCAHLLAKIHEFGEVVEQDGEKAIDWYSWFIDHAPEENTYFTFEMDTAELRNDALLSIAGIYWDGAGIAPDDSKAIHFFQLAALEGSMRAQSFLGEIHRSGTEAIEADEQEALKWYRMAAEQGDANSQVIVDELLAKQHEAKRKQLMELAGHLMEIRQ